MNTSSYNRYLLGILLVLLSFNGVDSVALALVMQDIKADLTLSDTQLGLLTGIAFALFYAIMGIPIARWADRGNRITIISLTTALWSAAVVLCGFVGNFVQLILVRIGVAVGQAGCMPAANSLIADHFTRAERPRATAIYMLSSPLSGVIGYVLAGWLNELYGWRVMFALLGLPGLALAVLVRFTLREPRLAKSTTVITPPVHPGFNEVLRVLWGNTTFRHLLFYYVLISLVGGEAQWQPTFFIRTYGLQSGELGTWFALIWGLGGFFGILCGGEFASRFAAHNERLQLKLVAIAYGGFAVTSACIYLAPNQYWAFGFMAIGALVGSLTIGPLFATIQTLVPPPMRATSLAILYLFGNLIGTGFGPLMVGALSDSLQPVFGEDSLRYALLAVCPGYVWAALHILRASKSITRDLRAAQESGDSKSQDRPSVVQPAGELMPPACERGVGA